MADPRLSAAFEARLPQVKSAGEALDEVLRRLREMPLAPSFDGVPMHDQFRSCKRFFAELSKLEATVKKSKAAVLEMQFNVYWMGKLRKRYDIVSYEKKKEVAKEINSDLRAYGFAISHPDNGSPCMVLAVGSPDGNGRYVLADRISKKRSNTSNTLLELFPIRLVPEPRRRESFLEAAESAESAE